MIRRIVSILTVPALCLLVWYSVLFARADLAFLANTPESIGQAIRLRPDNATYHALLAEHLEAAGQNPDHELELATDLNPSESRYWIRRAFRAELEKDYASSERYLIEAKRVDKGFDPRSALMNYYFRRGNLPEFWKAAKEALNVSYDDRSSVFRMCLAANDDPSATFNILERRDLKFAFFAYLLGHGRVDSATTMVPELAGNPSSDEVPVLLNYCSSQAGQNTPSALLAWNSMCHRKLIPFAELSPAAGAIVTNGDFSANPSQQGFDWIYGSNAALKINPLNAERGLSIDIDGNQPDRVSLIGQQVPLSPGTQYVVGYEYRLVGPPGDTGLHWSVVTGKPDSDPDAESAVLSAHDWVNGTLAFSSGQHENARLMLVYKRTSATVRWKGTVQLREVTSRLEPPIPAK